MKTPSFANVHANLTNINVGIHDSAEDRRELRQTEKEMLLSDVRRNLDATDTKYIFDKNDGLDELSASFVRRQKMRIIERLHREYAEQNHDIQIPIPTITFPPMYLFHY